eukprot:3261172-Amphidinium_carterae.2
MVLVFLGTFPQNVRYHRNKFWRWIPPEWLTTRYTTHARHIDATAGCTVYGLAELEIGACAARSGLQEWGLEADVLHKSLA